MTLLLEFCHFCRHVTSWRPRVGRRRAVCEGCGCSAEQLEAELERLVVEHESHGARRTGGIL